MPANPKTIQTPPSELDKPAKDRIAEQANDLFTSFGVNISLDTIALFAHTNVATVVKYFGTRERLVSDFLGSLIKEAERDWKEIEQEYPNDPEAQLRKWVHCAEFAADLSMQEPQAQLSRAAVDLISANRKNPLLTVIEIVLAGRAAEDCEAVRKGQVSRPVGLGGQAAVAGERCAERTEPLRLQGTEQ